MFSQNAMKCLTFQRNLEDYLQDGLDFSGRFAMERHSRQCIRCGREMAEAQRLRQAILELQRVKAPSGFESSVLNKIGLQKARRPSSGIRNLWIYGFQWLCWRNLILASSSLAILGSVLLGLLVKTASAPLQTAAGPAKQTGRPAGPAVPIERASPKVSAAAAVQEVEEPEKPSGFSEQKYLRDEGVPDTEYVEYQMMGPDHRLLTIRLPRYRQTSEEYFIRNVSH